MLQFSKSRPCHLWLLAAASRRGAPKVDVSVLEAWYTTERLYAILRPAGTYFQLETRPQGSAQGGGIGRLAAPPKKTEGGDLHTFLDLSWPRDHRARHGYSPTHPDSALCSRRVLRNHQTQQRIDFLESPKVRFCIPHVADSHVPRNPNRLIWRENSTVPDDQP